MFNDEGDVIISWECNNCRGNEDVLVDKFNQLMKLEKCPHCGIGYEAISIWEKTDTGFFDED